MTTIEREQAKFKRTFLDNDYYSEEIGYTHFGESEKSIKAVVYRKPNKSRGVRNSGSSQNVKIYYDYEIRISTSATDGISSVTVKGDSVSIPLNIGSTPQSMQVVAIIAQDAGSWHLGLQA